MRSRVFKTRRILPLKAFEIRQGATRDDNSTSGYVAPMEFSEAPTENATPVWPPNHPDLSEAISMEKRYFTSDLSMRS